LRPDRLSDQWLCQLLAALWLRRGTAEKSHEIAPWHLIELHLIPNLEDRGPRP